MLHIAQFLFINMTLICIPLTSHIECAPPSCWCWVSFSMFIWVYNVNILWDRSLTQTLAHQVWVDILNLPSAYEHACSLCILASTAAGYEKLFHFSRLILLISPEFWQFFMYYAICIFLSWIACNPFFSLVFIIFLIFGSLYILKLSMHVTHCYLNLLTFHLLALFVCLYVWQ